LPKEVLTDDPSLAYTSTKTIILATRQESKTKGSQNQHQGKKSQDIPPVGQSMVIDEQTKS
jgi:hypothetical protein